MHSNLTKSNKFNFQEKVNLMNNERSLQILSLHQKVNDLTANLNNLTLEFRKQKKSSFHKSDSNFNASESHRIDKKIGNHIK